jgi:hypothetical protein
MANWRAAFDDEQLRRIDQIMNYSNGFGYELESDQELIAVLVTRLQNGDRYVTWLENSQVWWLRQIRERPHRHYTCHLLKRFDYLILWLQGKKPHWSEGGFLCVGYFEALSYFPSWMYRKAIDLKEKYWWAELILDA